MPVSRQGVVLGAAAYVLWGLSALYWPLVEPTGPVEILALRMVWSPVAIGLLVLALGRRRRVTAILRRPRQVALLALGGVLTTVNWALFIWATMNGHVVDASLGYFITPLVSVALGVVVLRERLGAWQWAGIGLGAAAVLLLTIGYGGPPWIALGLAVTFGTYGLIKKRVGVGAVEGLMVETAVLSPPALIYTVVLQAGGGATFGHVSAANTLLGVGAGFVMTVPMLLFSAAAKKIPLSLTGMLQYIEPIVQFLVGLLVFREPMPVARWAAFALLWLGLAVLTADAVRRRGPRPAAQARRDPPRSARSSRTAASAVRDPEERP
ncbi:chloramphenicol-sensitive protein RarD [Nonomuraea muscovyensis]|uniref:Chloramphenicol-sensitive protein RarD n=1 Tax=Nonomuraea muscovyensis TaxID=1124761 RepID=A0A7X0C941_9ACTN|nr:EamA family transporter RarD [Nonomuraea muscovyensis]MBB6349755.1 chloramphenicol-sensitive protein RarD [Nonomuraea muscovyensis]